MRAIEKMFPTQDRIELFARRKTSGWSVWGLDVFEENGSNCWTLSEQEKQGPKQPKFVQLILNNF
jgi:N6-adenosine-specific RNA methylase IME4